MLLYSELLRHLTYKGHNKSEVSPNLVRMIQYFNRVRGRGGRKKEETFLTIFFRCQCFGCGQLLSSRVSRPEGE